MKIKGCGIDIIEIERIKKAIKNNNKFVERVFTKEEIEYCQAKKNKWQHFAVRFAAKEAVLKALNDKEIDLKSIWIKNETDGMPYVVLKGKNKLLKGRILISLSHSHNYAVAQAIWVADGEKKGKK